MGQVGDGPRAQDVVLDGFARIRLHHGHMLVGSGVKQHRGGEIGQDLVHADLIADVGHAGDHLDFRIIPDQFAMDEKQAVFGLLHQNQGGRGKTAHLPAQLRANASAGTRHNHPPAPDDAGDGLAIQSDRVAAQEILDGHVADLRQVNALHEFAGPRNDPRGDVAIFTGPGHSANRLAGSVIHADQGLPGSVLVDHFGHLRQGPQHVNAMNDRTDAFPTFFQEAHRPDARVGRGCDFPGHQSSRTSGPDE